MRRPIGLGRLGQLRLPIPGKPEIGGTLVASRHPKGEMHPWPE
jgi:hypothetical protein